MGTNVFLSSSQEAKVSVTEADQDYHLTDTHDLLQYRTCLHIVTICSFTGVYFVCSAFSLMINNYKVASGSYRYIDMPLFIQYIINHNKWYGVFAAASLVQYNWDYVSRYGGSISFFQYAKTGALRVYEPKQWLNVWIEALAFSQSTISLLLKKDWLFLDSFPPRFTMKQTDVKYGVSGDSPCSRDVAVVTVSGTPSTL